MVSPVQAQDCPTLTVMFGHDFTEDYVAEPSECVLYWDREDFDYGVLLDIMDTYGVETLNAVASGGAWINWLADIQTTEEYFDNTSAIALLEISTSSNPDKDATANATPTTPATTIHGLPGNNPANGGSSASPEGQGVNDGNGIHNIAGGAPGQNGGVNGAADGDQPSETMHGGLNDFAPGHAD